MTPPVVEDFLTLALRPARHRRVLLARLLEAADTLVHVPAERTDDADVVVVPHVAVGHDVEPHGFLLGDDRGDGVGIGFFVGHFLERDADVPAKQLMLEPARPRIRTDHRGREQLVNDFSSHRMSSRSVLECVGVSISAAPPALDEQQAPHSQGGTPTQRPQPPIICTRGRLQIQL